MPSTMASILRRLITSAPRPLTALLERSRAARATALLTKEKSRELQTQAAAIRSKSRDLTVDCRARRPPLPTTLPLSGDPRRCAEAEDRDTCPIAEAANTYRTAS